MYVNATPVRITLVRVSGNPDQQTRIRAGTRTRVCVYAPLVREHKERSLLANEKRQKLMLKTDHQFNTSV